MISGIAPSYIKGSISNKNLFFLTSWLVISPNPHPPPQPFPTHTVCILWILILPYIYLNRILKLDEPVEKRMEISSFFFFIFTRKFVLGRMRQPTNFWKGYWRMNVTFNEVISTTGFQMKISISYTSQSNKILQIDYKDCKCSLLNIFNLLSLEEL